MKDVRTTCLPTHLSKFCSEDACDELSTGIGSRSHRWKIRIGHSMGNGLIGSILHAMKNIRASATTMTKQGSREDTSNFRKIKMLLSFGTNRLNMMKASML